jgi:phosphatidate cytidylyltransferase
MDDLHALNEAINQRAGRKLLPSIAVSLALLAAVFSTVYFVPVAFAVLVWIAVMLATRELVDAYKQG